MSFLLPLTGPPAHGAHHHVLVPGPLHAVGAAAARWGPGTAGTRRPGSGGELASMSLCCLCLFCFGWLMVSLVWAIQAVGWTGRV